MKKKTIVILSVALSVVLVAGVLGTGIVLAASNSFYPPIVEKLAEKLNVSNSDVNTAFDEVHQEKRQEAQERFEQQLDQAVEDGKITKEQKEVLLKKNTEIQEQQEEVMELKQDLKNWADENDVDLRNVMGKGSKGGLKGHRGGPGGPGGGCFGPGPAQ